MRGQRIEKPWTGRFILQPTDFGRWQLILLGFSAHVDSSKASAQGMYKAGAIPVGEPYETWGGTATARSWTGASGAFRSIVEGVPGSTKSLQVIWFLSRWNVTSSTGVVIATAEKMNLWSGYLIETHSCSFPCGQCARLHASKIKQALDRDLRIQIQCGDSGAWARRIW